MNYVADPNTQLEEDEQLAKALQESLSMDSPVPTPPRTPPRSRSPPRNDRGNVWQPYPPFFPYGFRYLALFNITFILSNLFIVNTTKNPIV